MSHGLDSSVDLSPYAKELITNGYHFVARYYNINTHWKNLSYAEANLLSGLGLRLVAVWENGYPTSAAYFSYNKGFTDGTNAFGDAKNTIHQPANTPIYFAVDFDPSPDIVNNQITRYFQGVADAFHKLSEGGDTYLIGAYGSGLVCKTLLDAGKVTHTWLAQSTGWQGYHTFTDFNIKQGREQTITSVDHHSLNVDLDESPNNNEGSFQITHLKNLLNPTRP